MCGSQKNGASAQTRRKECWRCFIKERDWASKIAAFTPPPWRQRRRGSGLESGMTDGTFEGRGEVVGLDIVMAMKEAKGLLVD